MWRLQTYLVDGITATVKLAVVMPGSEVSTVNLMHVSRICAHQTASHVTPRVATCCSGPQCTFQNSQQVNNVQKRGLAGVVRASASNHGAGAGAEQQTAEDAGAASVAAGSGDACSCDDDGGDCGSYGDGGGNDDDDSPEDGGGGGDDGDGGDSGGDGDNSDNSDDGDNPSEGGGGSGGGDDDDNSEDSGGGGDDDSSEDRGGGGDDDDNAGGDGDDSSDEGVGDDDNSSEDGGVGDGDDSSEYGGGGGGDDSANHSGSKSDASNNGGSGTNSASEDGGDDDLRCFDANDANEASDDRDDGIVRDSDDNVSTPTPDARMCAVSADRLVQWAARLFAEEAGVPSPRCPRVWVAVPQPVRRNSTLRHQALVLRPVCEHAECMHAVRTHSRQATGDVTSLVVAHDASDVDGSRTSTVPLRRLAVHCARVLAALTRAAGDEDEQTIHHDSMLAAAKALQSALSPDARVSVKHLSELHKALREPLRWVHVAAPRRQGVNRDSRPHLWLCRRHAECVELARLRQRLHHSDEALSKLVQWYWHDGQSSHAFGPVCNTALEHALQFGLEEVDVHCSGSTHTVQFLPSGMVIKESGARVDRVLKVCVCMDVRSAVQTLDPFAIVTPEVNLVKQIPAPTTLARTARWQHKAHNGGVDVRSRV